MVTISALSAIEGDEEATLLAFKAAAISNGYNDPLASWNRSTNGGYCSWEGEHPASLGRLRHLHILDLSHNAFSGLLPANLTSCTSLIIMVIRYNNLSGNLPLEIGHNLKHLKVLNLHDNNLTGQIPASLANLSSLSYFSLASNQLEGTIPTSIGILKDLSVLGLGFNNLSGEPPISLYNLSSLEMLQIEWNMLSGSLPTDIGSRFPSMRMLLIYKNKFTGIIPASLSNLTSLQVLDLWQNMLKGHVPSTIGRIRALQNLYLSDNMLEADDGKGWEFIASLSNYSQLKVLDLSNITAFTGHLPSSIVNLSTTLQFLDFSATGIWGSIPSAIDNLVGLEFLDAHDASISGVIPDSIGKLGNLTEIYLYNSNLSGQIPSSIGNLSKLAIPSAYQCTLEGPIPPTIGKLKSLFALFLSSNHLNGSITREIFELSFSYLDLSYNSLSGPLHSQVDSLQNLNQLFLSRNQLSGEIPESIGKCTVLQELWLDDNLFNGSIPQYLNKALTTLNLSVNELSGSIPDAIGSISGLEQLYLAHNNLSGPIPAVLQNLTALWMLDLSFNNLQGEVPKEGIFRNFANLTITGNNKLCGGIPQFHLVPCNPDSVKKEQREVEQRRKQKGAFEPPMVEEQFERVSYHALSNGTNGFSEANLLGKGSFGTVYKCAFQSEETVVAVKVFDLQQSGYTKSFVAECEALRRVRHRCLMKIITCCSSINEQGQDFKALVFEFMPNGSLNRWLHTESGMPTLNNTLSLAQRLDIVVDIMDALDYLHNHCQLPIIHCDLKPSNILLAEDMSARVGDFGINRIISESECIILQNSKSTIGIRGSIGYVAPGKFYVFFLDSKSFYKYDMLINTFFFFCTIIEYGEGSPITTFGDVYSLGILLLEIFTGRSPTDDMFRGSMNLHKFSEDALPGNIWEIADKTMWLHTGTYDNNTRNIIEKCFVQVIALGVSCSRKQHRERTLIQDAVNEMHAIRDSYLKFARTLVVEDGVGTFFL
ncbi:unnamed protein product [Miscanthus lutarioriparius]|uniref:Receptor kinase-like protein Xa21 n=1 Tax=Miscanthus lutarioriparius TaxID=422564 RepID=A0A811P293_9POAL|nr:unnamed protein product [Miscanthus lutarioriparius]